ncbi:hypothetical protein [Sphingobacterium sp.]|uniref:hypothetical protein n=1 Tax=Sphingobacterium sp. TaxID=341027 RepID=UPI0031E2D355
MKKIEKNFINAIYQNFDGIQQSLKESLNRVRTASGNGYRNLFNSNAWGRQYHKLSIEELFFMNLNNDAILAILNVSIYHAIVQNDYRHLLNGVFTYSRLRSLQRAYIPGPGDWIVVESLINNDIALREIEYPKSLDFNTNVFYDTTLLLSGNLLRTILINPDLKTLTLEQYSKFIGEVSSKFDKAFLHYLFGLITEDYTLCQTNFAEMEQLYSRCQWLSSGWYRDANLNKSVPIFLLGLYQLKNTVNIAVEIELENEFLNNTNRFILDNPNYTPQIFNYFDGELGFLNETLTNNFVPFYQDYKIKLDEIKIVTQGKR